MTPRISFVIPAYNTERWVSKALWSCRSQTIKQIEIVVVNDGSSDDTKDIINWHAKEDKRVVPVQLEQNVGRSAARNIGNDMASADIICVLDADDMATRNRAKDTIASFQLKKPDFLYGSFFVTDSLGNVTAKIPSAAFDPELSRKNKLNYICHSTVAYTKKLTESIRYDTGVYSKLGFDDWKFQWDAFNAGFILKNLKTPLCYYRQTGDSISSTRDIDEVNKAKEAFLAK